MKRAIIFISIILLLTLGVFYVSSLSQPTDIDLIKEKLDHYEINLNESNLENIIDQITFIQNIQKELRKIKNNEENQNLKIELSDAAKKILSILGDLRKKVEIEQNIVTEKTASEILIDRINTTKDIIEMNLLYIEKNPLYKEDKEIYESYIFWSQQKDFIIRVEDEYNRGIISIDQATDQLNKDAMSNRDIYIKN
jgi:predicted O-linked N-acetylglucosamine transferase (SPINDLY family)